mmetsp:Transcript_33717/g.54643  ORF Transcript_33717/g.54643 Transcript_33717/m.54643 type:complete len:94 (-) Transcript_33717:195-476(-)
MHYIKIYATMYASIYRERYGPEEASIKKEGENTTISSLIYLSPINTAEVSGGSETKNDSGCGSDWRAKACVLFCQLLPPCHSQSLPIYMNALH